MSCEYISRIRKRRRYSVLLQSVNLGQTDPFELNGKAQQIFRCKLQFAHGIHTPFYSFHLPVFS